MSRWFERKVTRTVTLYPKPDTMRMIKLVAKGMLNKQIAAEFGTSEQRVKNVLRQVYRHYNVPNRTSLIVHVVGLGIVTCQDCERERAYERRHGIEHAEAIQ